MKCISEVHQAMSQQKPELHLDSRLDQSIDITLRWVLQQQFEAAGLALLPSSSAPAIAGDLCMAHWRGEL